MAGKKKRRRRGGMTIPLTIVAGFAPVISGSVSRLRTGGIGAVSDFLLAGMTGFDRATNSWSLGNMSLGLGPILLGGVAHKVAGMLGVNRALGRAKIPLLRV